MSNVTWVKFCVASTLLSIDNTNESAESEFEAVEDNAETTEFGPIVTGI